MTRLHVCTGGPHVYRRRLVRCPIDECITECVATYFDNPWYDPIIQCTKCGEQWSDGQLWPRPFRPGWRPEQQATARALWEVATYGPAPDIDWEFWFGPAESR